METIFRYNARFLMCQNCGAPMEVATAGGAGQCEYCSAQYQLVSRKEEPVEPAAAARQVDEGQRLVMLRQQDGTPMVPPPGVQSLLQNGALPEWKVQEATAVWQNTRRQLESTNDFQAAESLLYLTILLSNHYADKQQRLQQRAMFESALEVFTLPRHRQMMRGALARYAALEGDLEAAERWLAPCNPRSEDLQSDTAYRISRATIDTARGDFNAVIQALGNDLQQVPIMDAMEAIAVLLRAHAWERLGQPAAAAQQLKQYMGAGGAGGREAMAKVLAAFAQSGWQMAPQAYQAASASYTVAAGNAAAAGAGATAGKVFYWVGLFNLVLGIVIGVAAVVFVVLALTAYPLLVAGIPGVALGGAISAFTMILIGAVFFMIGRAMARSGETAKRLRTEGLQAQGQIVSLQPTGMSVNNVPQVAITVSVQLPGRPPYQASAKMLLQPMAMAQLTPGQTVPLRVDPRDPQEVLIELQ